MDSITASLAQAGKMSFVVFDACRNVPMQRAARPYSRGLPLTVNSAGRWSRLRRGRAAWGPMRAFKHAYSPRNSSSRVLNQGRRPVPSPAGSAIRRPTLWVPQSLDKRLYDFNFTQAAASAGQLTPLAKPPVAAANESRSKESRPPRYLSGGSGSGGSGASKKGLGFSFFCFPVGVPSLLLRTGNALASSLGTSMTCG